MRIDSIDLRLIPDSRGNNTLEATMHSGNLVEVASVPSGKSTGATEVVVLDPMEAVEKLEQIKPEILSGEYESVEQLDEMLLKLDGTPNKAALGGNLILALSIAFTKLLARSQNLEPFSLVAQIAGTKPEKLPWCFYNLIEGGVHAENSLPFQEYLFVPTVNSPKKSLTMVMELLQLLADEIHAKYGQLKMGDEGGYTIPSSDPLEGLQVLKAMQEKAGQTDTKISLDVAASALAKNGRYSLREWEIDLSDLWNLYKKIIHEYKILSIEDPFDEKDIENFIYITKELGDSAWIVADDLTTTSPRRVQEIGEKKAANAVIVKPNQIGSVSETIKAALLAKSFGWKIIVSHRSGETMDDFIADLAVGLQADGLKSGCPLQKQRLIKYQRLIEIEKELQE